MQDFPTRDRKAAVFSVVQKGDVRANRFSLAPMKFDDAIRKILASPPEPKLEKKKTSKKTARKKSGA